METDAERWADEVAEMWPCLLDPTLLEFDPGRRIEDGFWTQRCVDCEGYGAINWHPHKLFQACVPCKGTGRTQIMLAAQR